MVRKTLLAIGIGATLNLALAGAAFAGERGGNGEQTAAPSHAASLCAFSGLEDNDFEDPVEPGVTQNWGQIIRVAGPLGGANSTLGPHGETGCNAHMYPNPGKQ